jgi:hypothetical protein
MRVHRECVDGGLLAGLFKDGTVLVPVPSSAPAIAGSIAVAERLAGALLQQGLGAAVWRGLVRTSPVRRSASAPAGTRPSVEDHFDSFAVAETQSPLGQILLVDDVVTKGRTLLAAAVRLQQALPHAHIRAFALLRTMSLTPEIPSLVQPCMGEIRWCRGDAKRIP